MSLLHQIQESVVQEGCDLGSVLLKLRLLAARLGSDVLEEWVKHESEGYPKDAEVIYVGAMLVGKGEAWFDDLQVYLDGNKIQP